MRTSGLGYGPLALCMIGSMLVLLMWPVPVRPYSATPGPVTALHATRGAVLIAWSLTIAARVLCSAWRSPLTPVRQALIREGPRLNDSRFLVLSILRC